MKFLNSMLVALEDDADAYDELTSYLNEQCISDSYQEALDILNSACDELRADLEAPSTHRRGENGTGKSPERLELEDECESEGDDAFDIGNVFSNNHLSVRIFDANQQSGRFSPPPQLLARQATVSLMDIYKSKSIRFTSSLEAVSENGDLPVPTELKPGSLDVVFPAGMKYKRLVVCPGEGTMVRTYSDPSNSSLFDNFLPLFPSPFLYRSPLSPIALAFSFLPLLARLIHHLSSFLS